MPASIPGLRRALFAWVFFSYAYFYQAGGANQNSRFDLVLAMVEHQRLYIDPYHTNTDDKACRGPRGRCVGVRGEHMYCDKAPGLSWLASPAYAVLSTLTPDAQKDAAYLEAASYVCVLFAVALPSALGAVLLCTLLSWMDLGVSALWISLAYALGTLAFPYSTLFYGHQTCAVLLLAAWLLLLRARRAGVVAPSPKLLLGCGVLLGLSVAVEYQVALAALALGLYAASFIRPLGRVGLIALGAAAVGCALAYYHTRAFGGPLTPGYAFSTKGDRGQGLFMGVSGLDLGALLHLTFLPSRGLFFSAPWLLWWLPGTGRLLRTPQWRAEGVLCAVIPLSFFWLSSSLVDWWGGYTFGPRYMVPALPFMAAGAGACFMPAAARRPRTAMFALAASVSVLMMLIATSVRPEVPAPIRSPFLQFLIPNFLAGQLGVNTQTVYTGIGVPGAPHAAWNLGQLLQLHGLLSLVPLLVAAGAFGVWMSRASRNAAR